MKKFILLAFFVVEVIFFMDSKATNTTDKYRRHDSNHLLYKLYRHF